MGRKQIGLNIVILAVLFIAMYFLTQNAQLIRDIVKTPQQLIAGTSTNANEEKETLPQELVKDAEKHIEGVKRNALDTTVEEIITFFSKTGKIVEDVRNVQKTVTDFISQ